MAIRRLRRDGHSLVVTIPPDAAGKAHLIEGGYVEIEADKKAGELRIRQVQTGARNARPNFVAIGRRVIKEDRTLLERLAAYDPDARGRG